MRIYIVAVHTGCLENAAYSGINSAFSRFCHKSGVRILLYGTGLMQKNQQRTENSNVVNCEWSLHKGQLQLVMFLVHLYIVLCIFWNSARKICYYFLKKNNQPLEQYNVEFSFSQKNTNVFPVSTLKHVQFYFFLELMCMF